MKKSFIGNFFVETHLYKGTGTWCIKLDEAIGSLPKYDSVVKETNGINGTNSNYGAMSNVGNGENEPFIDFIQYENDVGQTKTNAKTKISFHKVTRHQSINQTDDENDITVTIGQ